jgi:ketosteroid isomerase-like protein
MSQENVELTRRAFQAFEDRDLDGLLAILDDDVEAFPILAGMEGGYHGHDGIRGWWAGLLGTFPDFRAEIVELHDLGELTIAALRLRGHGAESDTPVDAVVWQVTRFRHGKCTGWRVYTSQSEALEAGGLSEWPAERPQAPEPG